MKKVCLLYPGQKRELLSGLLHDNYDLQSLINLRKLPYLIRINLPM